MAAKNRSSSLCFQDKCFFAFYTEIQDGHQMGTKQFWPKLASNLRGYPVGQKFC